MQKKWMLYGLAVVMAVAMACGGDARPPVSPTSTVESSSGAAADGSTLKVTTPALVSPANGVRLDTRSPQLVATVATGKYVTASFTYRVQLRDANDTLIQEASGGPTADGRVVHTVGTELDIDKTYKWRVRAESGTAFGSWSAYWTFLTPNSPTSIPSFQTATSLWDNLTDGKTIGIATGMEFTVGKGARTVSNESNIKYRLFQTLSAGEMSFYVDNLNPLSAGDKTKLCSMMEGDGDITTNDYRFTIEKRGATYPAPGQVRWRMITGDSSPGAGRIFDGGPWQPTLDKTKTHFVRVLWGNGDVTIQINEADPVTGALGVSRLNERDGYDFTYKPVPHTAFIGAPVGRAGPADASVSNMTVRLVWIGGSGTKRPGTFAPLPMPGFGFEGPGF